MPSIKEVVKRKTVRVVAAILLLFTSVFSSLACAWVTYHLVLIKKYGIVAIAEPNQLILNIEIVAMALVTLVGIGAFGWAIWWLKRRNNNKQG